MPDAERLEKRLAILDEINKILPHCLCNNANTKHHCEHCDKLSELGQQLLGLTKPRKIIKSDGSITQGVVKERPYRCKPKNFTINEYVQAKINGFTDVQFATNVSMSMTSLYRWKRTNINEIKNMMMFK